VAAVSRSVSSYGTGRELVGAKASKQWSIGTPTAAGAGEDAGYASYGRAAWDS
jgi:hypothetical protein